MKNKTFNDFFDHFGTVQQEKIYPKETPMEGIVIDIAEQLDKDTQPGHGIFFDFSTTPELEKPVLDYLVKGFGWQLEKPYFIRKRE